jgi:enoyl-CoA hydratase/carnithine racemase
MRAAYGALAIEVGPEGVAVGTFDRPPVNAVSVDVYEALAELVNDVTASDAVRVIVLTAPPASRAWCGGADLHDFVDMTPSRRADRYAFINATLPRLYDLDRPVIAAINGPAIGVGVILVALCDLRIASDDGVFACPEIDYGLIAGGAGCSPRSRRASRSPTLSRGWAGRTRTSVQRGGRVLRCGP